MGAALPARKPDETVLSVARAFRMVELLSDAEAGMSLADLSRACDINKAIAVRLLDTLEGLELVWRDETRQRYHLTYKISNLGLRQLQKGRLLDQCADVLKGLAGETGELVRLAVVEQGERITWVHAISGARRMVQLDPTYSLEIQLNTHAIAKAWLATLPFARAWQLMSRQGVAAATAHSLTSEAALREDLAETARRGYAVSFEEQEGGVGAIAAAVMVRTLQGVRHCVGAVSLAAPISRMSRAELQACAPALQATVVRLAERWPLEHAPPEHGRRE